MSDNDQISRSELLDRISVLESEAQVAIIECAARNSVSEGRWIVAKMELEIVRLIIENAPPAEQPMSAVEYGDTSNRMLKEDYRAWDRLMVFEENDDADKAIAWMEEWAREHPEERSEE